MEARAKDELVTAVRARSGVACTQVVTKLSAPGSEDAVHVDVWHVSAHAEDCIATALATLLDPTERAYASRFRFSEDRDRYATARGMTRHILAEYLNLDAAALTFGHSPKGKPFLDPQRHAAPLHFNWSHSGRLVVVAIARHHEVGIDIEWLDPNSPIETLGDAFLTKSDRHSIDAGPTGTQTRQSLRVWTRKEAALKAVGLGLTAPMNEFSAGPLDAATHSLSVPHEKSVHRVLVRDLVCPSDFVGAVGVRVV